MDVTALIRPVTSLTLALTNIVIPGMCRCFFRLHGEPQHQTPQETVPVPYLFTWK